MQIDIEICRGHLSVCHKKSLERDYRETVEIAASRYDYPHLSSWTAMRRRRGSDRHIIYFGVRDTGTGHIQPMKLLVGLARQAMLAGASLHEKTKALKVERNGGRSSSTTDRGSIGATGR